MPCKDKAPLERTADRLARYFLPAVLALAALTFLVCLIGYGTGWLRPPAGESELSTQLGSASTRRCRCWSSPVRAP